MSHQKDGFGHSILASTSHALTGDVTPACTLKCGDKTIGDTYCGQIYKMGGGFTAAPPFSGHRTSSLRIVFSKLAYHSPDTFTGINERRNS